MYHLIDRALTKLSDRPLERRNVVWFLLTDLARLPGLALAGGTVLQTFQVRVGLTKRNIGLISSSGQIASALSMSTLMGVSDRIRRRVEAASNCLLFMSIIPVGFTILSLLGAKHLTPGVAFAVMFSVSALGTFTNGFFMMVVYSMFAHVIRNEIRGRLWGLSGLIASGAVMGIGLASAAILDRMGFPRGFALCFGAAVALQITAGMMQRQLKEMPELISEGRRAASPSPLAALREIWALRQFRILLPAFILRGIGDGAVFFTMAVALERLGLPDEYAGWATSAGAAGTLLGNLTIALTVDPFGAGVVCFAADLLVALALTGIVLTKLRAAFLALFFLLQYGGIIEGTVIPLGCFFVVPRQLMGAFSGIRLMLLALTSALVVPAAGELLDKFDPVPIFFAAALVKLAAGILYWYGFSQTEQLGSPRENQGE